LPNFWFPTRYSISFTGDSGSGLFIKIGSTYFLKGIVSSSLFKANGQCDVDNYAVYTDIPQFSKWIENPNDLSPVFGSTKVPPTTPATTNLPVIQPTTEPPVESCGVMSQPESLIQGGQRASRKSFPWTVAIFTREDFDLYEHKAVGTLISDRHVVSLGNPLSYRNNANVLLPIDVNRLKMYLGVESFSEAYILSSLIIDGALKIVLHPKIRTQVPRSNDVAVIFLLSPILRSEFIAPVCLLPPGNFEVAGKVGYAVGWGINEAGVVSEYKKKTPLTVSDQRDCQQSYSNYFTSNNGKYFCAASPKKSSTACELDDPFYMKIDRKWFLKGLINSYFFNPDENKCSLSSPVLFEDVSSYTNWIQTAIN
jgi:hypothetical protein